MSDAALTQGRLGSFIVTVFFLIAGFVVLYDTLSYSDRDSQVFPQTVAVALILFACLSLGVQLIRHESSEGFGEGSWWRRILLVVTMLLSCAAMPYLGFLPAAAIAFIGGLIAAMHVSWSLKSGLIYAGSGMVIMLTFFALFKFILQVPLP